jgi:two-component system response regulator DctR
VSSAVAPRRIPQRTAPEIWNVLVVEDSPSVADVHCRIVDATPGFQAIAVRRDGEAAYEALSSLRPDIAIVDLTMPGGDGLSFLRRIRAEGVPLDVIVVTASRAPEAVRESLQLGAIDYLVKPFSPERLQASLAAAAQRARTLRRGTLGQEEVDLVNCSGAVHLRRLPKGLRRSTLLSIRSALLSADDPLTADDVGVRVGIARVTARRYLEYLDVIGAVRLERESSGPGRPRNRYRPLPE